MHNYRKNYHSQYIEKHTANERAHGARNTHAKQNAHQKCEPNASSRALCRPFGPFGPFGRDAQMFHDVDDGMNGYFIVVAWYFR